MPCISSCTNCSSALVCLNCDFGYYLELNNCIECNPTCVSCDSNGCTYCINFYTLLTNSVTQRNYCAPCPNNCMVCNSTTKCQFCSTDYFLDTESKCSQCSSNCNMCFNYTHCLHCTSNYFLENNACYSCPNNCQFCYANGTCIVCDTDFLLNQENLCINISGCYLIQGNFCAECDSQHYLSNGVCINNGYPCLQSESFSHRCYQCGIGYYLTNDFQCNSCIKYCDYCINGNECINCFYSFYFNNNTKTCEQCPENCASCSNGSSCDKCS